MFLDMMTADAAASHGHEFSKDRSHTQQDAFSFPRFRLGLFTSAARQTERPQVAPPPPSDKLDAPSPQATRSRKSIMFAEPEAQASDDNQTSRPATPDSITSGADRPRRRPPRPKTVYNLCHPPPNINPRQKLHMRPKVLLQLQQVSATSRPKPAFEAVPAVALAMKTKLAKKLARAIKAVKFGPDDIIVKKAEDYNNRPEKDDSSDEERTAREVVGVVCYNYKKDESKGGWQTRICMNDGSSWDVALLPSGAYEFVSTDEHGLKLKARWVPRAANRRKSGQSQNRSPSVEFADEKKFNFSTISPRTRRHPIIASLKRTSIDVLDSYTIPSPTSSAYLTTSPVDTPPSAISDTQSYLEAAEPLYPKPSIKTDEALHNLILVTGLWVAFQEGWSPAYRTFMNPSRSYTDNRDSFTAPRRSISLPDVTLDSRRTSIDSPDLPRTKSAKLFRPSSFFHRGSDSTSPLPTPTSTPHRHSFDTRKTRCRRANSVSSASGAIPRIASFSRAKRISSDFAKRDAHREGEEHRQPAPPARELTAVRESGEGAEPVVQGPPVLVTANSSLLNTPSPSPLRGSAKDRRDLVQSEYFSAESGAWEMGFDDAGSVQTNGVGRPKSIEGPRELNGHSKKEKKRLGWRFKRFLGVFQKKER